MTLSTRHIFTFPMMTFNLFFFNFPEKSGTLIFQGFQASPRTFRALAYSELITMGQVQFHRPFWFRYALDNLRQPVAGVQKTMTHNSGITGYHLWTMDIETKKDKKKKRKKKNVTLISMVDMCISRIRQLFSLFVYLLFSII